MCNARPTIRPENGEHRAAFGRAFTLIELLVVVAIIALLVSILVPSLQRARESAKDVVCKSNMHSIATALALYATEHNGQLPYGNVYSAYYDEHWQPALAIYLGIKRSDHDWEKKRWWGTVNPHDWPDGPPPWALYCLTGYANSHEWNDYYGTYGSHYSGGALSYSGYPPEQNAGKYTYPYPRAKAYEVPPGVFIIGEGSISILSPNAWPFNDDLSGNDVPDSTTSHGPYVRYNNAEPRRHPGGEGGGHANYAYADGHASSHSFAEWEDGRGVWKMDWDP